MTQIMQGPLSIINDKIDYPGLFLRPTEVAEALFNERGYCLLARRLQLKAICRDRPACRDHAAVAVAIERLRKIQSEDRIVELP